MLRGFLLLFADLIHQLLFLVKVMLAFFPSGHYRLRVLEDLERLVSDSLYDELLSLVKLHGPVRIVLHGIPQVMPLTKAISLTVIVELPYVALLCQHTSGAGALVWPDPDGVEIKHAPVYRLIECTGMYFVNMLFRTVGRCERREASGVRPAHLVLFNIELCI